MKQRGCILLCKMDKDCPSKTLITLQNTASQTVDKTLLVSTPEAFFLFSVQKVCT